MKLVNFEGQKNRIEYLTTILNEIIGEIMSLKNNVETITATLDERLVELEKENSDESWL